MANMNVHPPIHGGIAEQGEQRGTKRSALLGGVAAEAIAAIGAIILSIVGLTGLLALQLSAVAAIVLGVALLFEGVAVGAQLPRSGGRILPRVEPETAEVSAEAIAGLAGVTLGIIALAGAGPHALLPIAAIVLGAGFIVAVQPLSETTTTTEQASQGLSATVVHNLSRTASGAHAFTGVAAVVLGIIELAMPQLVSLSLVAFLAMSGTLVLGSAAIGGRLANLLR